MRNSRQSYRGFTLVEMLVVIAIVALVIGFSFPAIVSMRHRAAQAREMAAARNLMTAWNEYSHDNNSQLLPGYKNGLPAFDEKGQPIAQATIGVAAARYPWRLAPYLAFNFRGLYLDSDVRYLEELENVDYWNYLYQVSCFPSLGLNTTWVGGDENQGGFNAAYEATFGKFYRSRLSQFRHTERLIVFASARGIDPQPNASSDIIGGYFRVKSPNFTETQWAAQYDPADAASCGQVASRNGDRTVCAFVAGHVEAKTVDELRDMRFWADQANDPNWKLTAIQ